MRNTRQFYRERRTALLRTMRDHAGGGLALLPTAPEVVRNRDSTYPYRPDSYFYYLSGFPEPEAVVALVAGPDGDRQVLFCREKNEEREIWDGFRYGPEAAKEIFGFDEALPIGALAEKLPELASDRPALFTPLGLFEPWDRQVTQLLNDVRARVRTGVSAPEEVVDVRAPLDTMRLVKDGHEADLMRRAGAISSGAHARAMAATRPGWFEYQVEAELMHEFLRHGAQAVAYPSIVASGPNACVLHYRDNDREMAAGDLLLIDAGCEYRGYASDITRTFPVDGRFSGPQKDVYELVLAAQLACLDAIRPGVEFHDYHKVAERVLAQGYLDLGLLQGTLDEVMDSGAYKQFYMHRAGHWLGMDVHDAGLYRVQGASQRLVPGMALTVEPGTYIRPADNVPEHFWNIGVRIEDDVLVTATGHENLTAAAPKSVAEVEDACRR
ncbi:MAG: aminopeptidase P N-terminal domain-containing protein [Betaproteobacteria bacterium]|nr:aminopeptidase P N-terminal domain-containing protein [Betaproteobacteria bacterium]MCC7215156.1 aminopeptidase P N-terminal domain-containing protein [Burkholderiales bacterium]